MQLLRNPQDGLPTGVLPVAQNCILLYRGFATCERSECSLHPAEYNSAIQQLPNLHYETGEMHSGVFLRSGSRLALAQPIQGYGEDDHDPDDDFLGESRPVHEA